jgi:Lar family restriction alleviation protein
MMTNDSKDQGREAFELLPCPFCGNDKNIAMANEKHDHSGGYFIACPDCDASTGLRFACGDDPRALLVEQWNRRAATSASALARDEASVALTDELPGATAALRDLLRAKDLPNEQGALSRVRGENMQKAWEHARALLAASQAATAAVAQDESAAFDSHEIDHGTHIEIVPHYRAASSATEPKP